MPDHVLVLDIDALRHCEKELLNSLDIAVPRRSGKSGIVLLPSQQADRTACVAGQDASVHFNELFPVIYNVFIIEDSVRSLEPSVSQLSHGRLPFKPRAELP